MLCFWYNSTVSCCPAIPHRIFSILPTREWDNGRTCHELAQLSWVLRSGATIRSTIWAQFNNSLLLFTPLYPKRQIHTLLLSCLLFTGADPSLGLSSYMILPDQRRALPLHTYSGTKHPVVWFSETTNTQFRVCLLGNLSALLSAQYTFQPDKMSGHIARNKTALTEIILSS